MKKMWKGAFSNNKKEQEVLQYMVLCYDQQERNDNKQWNIAWTGRWGNNERKVAEFFNSACINVVENTARKKPLSVLEKDVIFLMAVNTTLEEHKYHPSVLELEYTMKKRNIFLFLKWPQRTYWN